MVEEVIPENPRIELVDGQVSYIPPLQIQNEADLKRIIQEKALRHEGKLESSWGKFVMNIFDIIFI